MARPAGDPSLVNFVKIKVLDCSNLSQSNHVTKKKEPGSLYGQQYLPFFPLLCKGSPVMFCPKRERVKD